MLTWLLLLLSTSASAQEWLCSQQEISESDGNICCNEDLADMVDAALDSDENMMIAARNLRQDAEDRFGGAWEAIVSEGSVGYASYLSGVQHCRKTSRNGREAVAWKVATDAEISVGDSTGRGPPIGRQSDSPAVGRKRAALKETNLSRREQRRQDRLERRRARRERLEQRRRERGRGRRRNREREPRRRRGRGRDRNPPSEESGPDPASDEAPRRPSSGEDRGRKRSPNEKLLECCKRNKNIPPQCYSSCNYAKFDRKNIVRMYLRQTCPRPALGSMLICASERKDHTPCCRKNRVPSYCNMFCNPSAGLSSPKGKQLGCIKKLTVIRNCFETASRTGRVDS